MPEIPSGSAILPIDSGRYGSPEIRRLFMDSSRYQFFLDIEAALARVQARLGIIPEATARVISDRAQINLVSLQRVAEIEADTRHELVAVLRAFAEICGEDGRSIHYGATSSDILDTATALQLKHAIAITEIKLKTLLSAMLKLAGTHKATVMVGRTHGQHALPITFGFKVAVWSDDLARNIQRLSEIKTRVLVGKMSGAVGSMAGWGPHGPAVQDGVMAELGLRSAEISNQIVARDRLAEFIFWTALTAAGLECVATEIRNLQRTELSELAEPFGHGGQVGSSAMPHKRNPVLAENVCSLARLLRSLIIPALENISLWHERDLTNSGNERFTVPQACILLDDILEKMIVIIETLHVDEERMLSNLNLSRHTLLSEKVLLALVATGVDRKQAYDLIQRLSFTAQDQKKDFATLLAEDESVQNLLGHESLIEILDEKSYVGHCQVITEKVIRNCSALVESSFETRGV